MSTTPEPVDPVDDLGDFLTEWRARRHLLTLRYPTGPDPLAAWGAPRPAPPDPPDTPRRNRTGVRPLDLPGPALEYDDDRLRSLGVLVAGLERGHLLEFLNDMAELRIGRAIFEVSAACDQLAARARVLATIDAEVREAAAAVMYQAWRTPFRDPRDAG